MIAVAGATGMWGAWSDGHQLSKISNRPTTSLAAAVAAAVKWLGVDSDWTFSTACSSVLKPATCNPPAPAGGGSTQVRKDLIFRRLHSYGRRMQNNEVPQGIESARE